MKHLVNTNLELNLNSPTKNKNSDKKNSILHKNRVLLLFESKKQLFIAFLNEATYALINAMLVFIKAYRNELLFC